MHTGGGHIEAYLVSAIPFLWLWISRSRYLILKPLGMLIFLLAVYVTMTTISRGGVVALGLALLVLVIGTLRMAVLSGRAQRRRVALLALLLVGAGCVIAVGWQGAYFQSRLARVDQDWQTRLTHWQHTVAMMDSGWDTALFGMGLGRFPHTFLYHNPAGVVPTTYRFERENDNTFLRIGSGETLYVTQRVPVAANRNYTLTLELRSRDRGASLDTPVCERHLLNSFQCRWFGASLPAADGHWHHLEIPFNSGAVGAGNLLTRRPVELTFYNPVAKTSVDVDNVRLLDEQGSELLNNGDFTQGADYWFFKTHSHLPWHSKNLWIHILFEQGWLGLITTQLLIGMVLVSLGIAVWRGDNFATVVLASTAGFLTVGLFDSLLDVPRLVILVGSSLSVGYFTGLTSSASAFVKTAQSYSHPVSQPSRPSLNQASFRVGA